MKKQTIISDYLHNEPYRKSLNQLSIDIFKLDLEPWYQAGFFNNRYIPYSFLLDGKIIANASISLLDIMIDHKVKRAIQIGTVMTDKQHRNKGLSTMLMKHIIEEYEGQSDFIYLFANDRVLNFYPKFGFEKVAEKSYTMSARAVVQQDAVIKILQPEVAADRAILSRLMENRKPVSHLLGVVNDQWPLSTSILDRYCDFLDRYYLLKEHVIVLADRSDGVLNLYDVISQHEINPDEIVEKMVSRRDNKVEFHFIPELKKYKVMTSTADWEDDTLFVRSKQPLRAEVLFPLTSHT
jgi:GNAT superfamily N-acetyltransferase